MINSDYDLLANLVSDDKIKGNKKELKKNKRD